MKTQKCPLKKPKPPRCFYASPKDYAFGRVSPSLYLHHMLAQSDPSAIEFFKKQKEYELFLLECKIKKRTATKQEYKKWRRQNEC